VEEVQAKKCGCSSQCSVCRGAVIQQGGVVKYYSIAQEVLPHIVLFFTREGCCAERSPALFVTQCSPAKMKARPELTLARKRNLLACHGARAMRR